MTALNTKTQINTHVNLSLELYDLKNLIINKRSSHSFKNTKDLKMNQTQITQSPEVQSRCWIPALIAALNVEVPENNIFR